MRAVSDRHIKDMFFNDIDLYLPKLKHLEIKVNEIINNCNIELIQSLVLRIRPVLSLKQ